MSVDCACPRSAYSRFQDHTPQCMIDRGLDLGPQPEHCPFCGAAKKRMDSWESHRYRCGTVIRRTRRPDRSAMTDTCVRRVMRQRDAVVAPLVAISDEMAAALPKEVTGSPRWLLLDYWITRIRDEVPYAR